MADHSFGLIALCALPQSGFGTANTTITGLTDTVTTADGLIIGVGTTGDGDSGIDLATHTREGLEAARIGNSAQADTFLRESPSGLKITFALGGGRNTADNPTVDANFNLATHFPGMDAVLKGAGLTGAAWGSGVGHEYKPSGDLTYLTVAVWFGGLKVVYQDVVVSSLTLSFPPGEKATAEVEFSTPTVTSWATQALTTITAGNQSTTTPTVQAVAHSFGATRPFETMEITISPATEESPDSNATNGVRIRQTGVDVTASSTMYAYTANPDHDRDVLILTSAPTTDLTFALGSATANAGVANSVAIELNNVLVRSIRPPKLGTHLGYEVELEGKAISTAGTEFTLRLF